MPVCIANVNWEMDLTVGNASSSDHLTFVIESLQGEDFTGWVLDSDQNRTPLSGRCSPVVGNPEVSAMHFDFNVLGRLHTVVRILMDGLGVQPEGLRAIFNGGFVALDPITGSTTGLQRQTAIDTGDTGTGTGQQT
jgi:hypothetical protein